MSLKEAPLDVLCEVVARRSCGEFICAASAVEIHVYLQRGRLAWATDSKHPFAFAKQLQAVAKIDSETFRQVIAECRQRNLPLGESLVEWGLVPWETVRACLRHQIEQSIALLSQIESAPTLFLERAYAEYNEELTFPIDEFVDEGRRSPSRPTPADVKVGRDEHMTTYLRDSVPGLSWVEMLEAERVVEADPDTEAPRVPLPFLRSTLLDGADFVAVRSSHGSLLGQSIAPGARSLWCQIAADSTFGAAVSAMASLVPDTRSHDGALSRPRGNAWVVGDRAGATAEELMGFMQRADEVLGAVLLSDRDDGAPIVACGREGLETKSCVDLARRRLRCLAQCKAPIASDDGSLESVSFPLRTMVTDEVRLWCFGAELASAESIWLFVDRRNVQGLGWAYLNALARVLGHTRGARLQ
jgi:hypothetical protein